MPPDSKPPTKTRCPYCSRMLDATTPTREGDQLRPGTIAVCSRCAGICVMDDNLGNYIHDSHTIENA
jgi:hypothetical protein